MKTWENMDERERGKLDGDWCWVGGEFGFKYDVTYLIAVFKVNQA